MAATSIVASLPSTFGVSLSTGWVGSVTMRPAVALSAGWKTPMSVTINRPPPWVRTASARSPSISATTVALDIAFGAGSRRAAVSSTLVRTETRPGAPASRRDTSARTARVSCGSVGSGTLTSTPAGRGVPVSMSLRGPTICSRVGPPSRAFVTAEAGSVSGDAGSVEVASSAPAGGSGSVATR